MTDTQSKSTRGPTEDDLKLVVSVFEETQSKSETARRLDLDRSTVRNRLNKAERNGLTLSDGAMSAVSNAGLAPREARHGWIGKKDPDTGNFESTFWKRDPLPLEDLVDYFRDAFSDLRPARPAPDPKVPLGALLNLHPLADVHHSMQAWGRETLNVDYDSDLSMSDMERAGAKVDALSPNTDEAILLVNGDFFHLDDSRNETPKSKHTLDVDSRYFKVIQTGIEMLTDRVDRLLRKHNHIYVRINRGNHDEHAHVALVFSLAAHYRLESRVTVEVNPPDLFHYRWGKCLIAAEHGDNASPEQLALYLSDVVPYYSMTPHRYFFTGHVHKLQAKDTGPVQWESMRAFCPPDSYPARKKLTGRRTLQTITFHKADGLILRAIDPVSRPPDPDDEDQPSLLNQP